jgi:hypothetical protein
MITTNVRKRNQRVNAHITEAEYFQNASDSMRLVILYRRVLKLEAKLNKILRDR